jgi:hypothetical protein
MVDAEPHHYVELLDASQAKPVRSRPISQSLASMLPALPNDHNAPLPTYRLTTIPHSDLTETAPLHAIDAQLKIDMHKHCSVDTLQAWSSGNATTPRLPPKPRFRVMALNGEHWHGSKPCPERPILPSAFISSQVAYWLYRLVLPSLRCNPTFVWIGLANDGDFLRYMERTYNFKGLLIDPRSTEYVRYRV